jgi:Kef-type K+ transport system membrane component KefB
LILCLGLSSLIGVAAIIGEFLAGMALAEASEPNGALHKQTKGVMEFLVPFFLVNIGMSLDLSVFNKVSTVWLAIIVTMFAVEKTY